MNPRWRCPDVKPWLQMPLCRMGPPPRSLCSEASCHSSGCKSRRHRSPIDVVVISSDGKGDRPVESLDVKVSRGWGLCSGQIRRGETSNLTGRSNCEPVKPRNGAPARSGLRERWECRAAELLAKTHVGIVNWTIRCPNSPRSERTACQEGEQPTRLRV
jgi:hypothetical protein